MFRDKKKLYVMMIMIYKSKNSVERSIFKGVGGGCQGFWKGPLVFIWLPLLLCNIIIREFEFWEKDGAVLSSPAHTTFNQTKPGLTRKSRIKYVIGAKITPMPSAQLFACCTVLKLHKIKNNFIINKEYCNHAF